MRLSVRTHYPAPATPAMKESCPLACPAKRSNSAANTDTCCPQSLSSIVCERARSSKDRGVYKCVPGKYSARIGSMDPVRTEHC